MKNRRPNINRRLVAIALFMSLWGGVIGARLYFLQVVRSADLKDRAKDQQERNLGISPRRGSIYDRNGNELAVSIEVDSLYAVPKEIDDPIGTAAFLSEILEVPSPSLETRLDSDRSFTWIERKLSARQVARIKAGQFKGLYFTKESKRFYPKRELASHVLGFVNLDDEGGSGLEYRFDDEVGGNPGKVVVSTDARGRSFHRLEQPPTTGSNLTTTIDQNIQYIVEKELMATVRRTRAVGMSVIVMDPGNGEILAMANYPQFNPNEYGKYPQINFRNRAISDMYEPGSTFKVVTAAAALEENLTNLEEEIDCQMGSIVLFGHRIHDHKPFGVLTVREILQFSSDVGIIKLGLRLGDQRFASYIDRLGFGKRSGVDLPAEARGLTKPASQWSRVSVGAISMGQEIAATPLQVVNLISSVGNGGILYTPFVVDKIENPIAGTIEQSSPQGRRVMSPETARRMQDALREVVVAGTATAAQIPGYSVAGKTGTAQKFDPTTGTYSLTKHVASFAGYAPATSPVVSAIIVIDEPQGGDHGGTVAAPVFKNIVEQILRYRSISPDSPVSPRFTEGQDSPAITRPSPPGDQNAITSAWELVDTLYDEEMGFSTSSDEQALVQLPVPSFYGKSLRQVTDESLRLGLRLRSIGSGAAVRQEPAAGALVRPGTRIQVQFTTSGLTTPNPDRLRFR
jgi:cell division protein FtsI (penicillin-binding protein 3)